MVKNNGSADTAAKIQPVRYIGSTTVSASYSATLTSLASYYATTPAHIWQRLGPTITKPYFDVRLPTKTEPQTCIVTPSHTTPLFRAFVGKAETVPSDAGPRRHQWQRAVAGHTLTVVGGLAAIGLPWRSVQSIVLDTPLASPYRSNRAPGIDAAVVACCVAQSTGAALTIRSPLPIQHLSDILPIPSHTTVTRPKLHPITAVPLGTKGYVNDELVTTITEHQRAGERILIYVNRLPKTNTTSVNVASIANDLAKRLGCTVAITHKNAPPSDAPVVVATTHALYDHALTWDFAVVLSLEGLISPNQPHSPAVATELLATLASRTPIYAQYRSMEHPFVQAARAQLSEESLAALPRFTHRLITAHIPKRPSSADMAYINDLSTMWPNPLRGDDTTYTFIASRTFTQTQRECIQRHPRTIRIFTDDTILPALERVDT